jgi:hypothetical protein
MRTHCLALALAAALALPIGAAAQEFQLQEVPGAGAFQDEFFKLPSSSAAALATTRYPVRNPTDAAVPN